MRAVKDPAPSRLSYKMQRLWLTPAVRRFTSFWLPLGATVALLAGAAIHPASRHAVVERVQAARDAIAARPEFRVTSVEISGANPRTKTQIMAALGVDFPVSSLDLDLPAMTEALSEIPVVEGSEITVSGDVLAVAISERRPAILWRGPEGLTLLDREGRVLGHVDHRREATRLALISGTGAEREIDEALDIYRTAGPLVSRIRALVRIGERRWDVALDRGLTIRLPETAPVKALQRVLALHQAEDVLSRDIAVIDMRVGQRPVLEPGAQVKAELSRVNAEGNDI